MAVRSYWNDVGKLALRRKIAGDVPALCGMESEVCRALAWIEHDCPTLEFVAYKVRGAPNLLNVELLPYNRFAGAKYAKLGRVYSPGFDESRAPDLSPLPVVL